MYNIYPFLFITSQTSGLDPFDSPEVTTSQQDIQKLKIQIFNYLLSFVIITGVLFTLVLMTFFEKRNILEFNLTEEEIDILKLEQEKRKYQVIDFRTQLKVVSKDLTSFLLILAGGLVFGTFQATQISINLSLSSWGFSEVSHHLFNFNARSSAAIA